MPGEGAGRGIGEATVGATGCDSSAVGRTRLPTGRISSFSRSPPRMIHTLSRSTEERIAPGSTSSFSRNAFGSFMPLDQRIARRAEGVEDTIVPTRTKLVRFAWEPVFPFTAGSRDAILIPSPGAKMLFHCAGGVSEIARPGVVAAAWVAPFGEYARSPRYRVRVTPSETAATTMEIPNTARQTGFPIPSP